jgi:hypothetical protein
MFFFFRVPEIKDDGFPDVIRKVEEKAAGAEKSKSSFGLIARDWSEDYWEIDREREKERERERERGREKEGGDIPLDIS